MLIYVVVIFPEVLFCGQVLSWFFLSSLTTAASKVTVVNRSVCYSMYKYESKIIILNGK